MIRKSLESRSNQDVLMLAAVAALVGLVVLFAGLALGLPATPPADTSPAQSACSAPGQNALTCAARAVTDALLEPFLR